jgi:hypothetical protein
MAMTGSGSCGTPRSAEGSDTPYHQAAYAIGLVRLPERRLVHPAHGRAVLSSFGANLHHERKALLEPALTQEHQLDLLRRHKRAGAYLAQHSPERGIPFEFDL